MATGKSSEAFGVLPDHGFPLGNQTIQIIQAMEMWIFCFPYSIAKFLCWRLMETECRMNCARISKYIRIWNADTQKFQAAKLVPCWLSKVSETAFELSGRQFQFRPGQVRHFTWEDGTVQTVQSIQKTPV